MDGIIIGIDPVALNIGALEIRWYGVAVAAAVAAAVIVAIHEARRKGISSADVYSISIWAILGGVVGARLFHVLDNIDTYAANPSAIPGFDGLAIWGAVLGGGTAAVVTAKLRRVPIARLADALVPALLIGQIIGRVGCIINGDAYGAPTGMPWGFIYTHPDASIPSGLMGIATHPYPVYEMLWNSVLLLGLLRLRKHLRFDGSLFLIYLGLYSLGRLGLGFVRQENEILLGLQQAQVLASVGFATALAIMVIMRRRLAASQRLVCPDREVRQ